MALESIIEELKEVNQEALESQQTIEDHVVEIHNMVGQMLAGQAQTMVKIHAKLSDIHRSVSNGAAARPGPSPDTTGLGRIHSVLVDIYKTVRNIRNDALKRADSRADARELSALTGSTNLEAPSGPVEGQSSKPKKDKGIDLLDLAVVAGILALLRKPIMNAVKNLVEGIKTSTVRALERVGRTISQTMLALIETRFGARVVTRWLANTRIAQAIQSFFTGVGNGLRGVGTRLSAFKDSFTKSSKMILGGIRTLIRGILRPLSMVLSGFTSGLSNILSLVPKVAGWVAGVVRFVAMPITIIMGIWETVQGALQRMNSIQSGSMIDKGIALLVGGLEGLAKFIIGYPLDLIKKVVGWIAGKLGFDNVKGILESFSFTDIITGIADAVHFGLSNIVTGLRDIFSKVLGGDIKGAFASFGEMMIRPINALIQTLLQSLNGIKIIGGLIPDSLYKKFGVDPDTGVATIDYTPEGAKKKADPQADNERKLEMHRKYIESKNMLFADESMPPKKFGTEAASVLKTATELHVMDPSLVPESEISSLKSTLSAIRAEKQEEQLKKSDALTGSGVAKSTNSARTERMTQELMRSTETTNTMQQALSTASPTIVSAPSSSRNTVNNSSVSLMGSSINTSDNNEANMAYGSRFAGR